LVKAIDDSGMEMLGNIPNLKELDISLCSKVTDDGLKAFTKNKKRILTSLNLTGLFLIKNEGLKSILLENSSTLQDVSLGLLSQTGVDGDMVASALCRCKGLKNLDIQGCTNVNNDSLYSLFSSNLENLISLNMSNVHGVDDTIATSAVSANKFLRVLRISNCTAVTDNFLDFLINSSYELLVLEINRTPGILASKVEELLKIKSPNLRVIRATNYVVNKENGYKVHLPNIHYVKPIIKGVTKPPPKKNDDKSPANQYKRLVEDRKPKRIVDLIY
jgi:hypothetical protein